MKIEEVISLYEFLANSNVTGVIGLWFMIVIIVALTFLFAKDKLVHLFREKIKTTFIITLLIVTIGYAFLYFEAQNRKTLLKLANCVKSECVMYGYKVVDSATVVNDFHCECSAEGLNNLLESHPSEFIKVMTDDDQPGIRIIDEKAVAAISQYNISHLPFIKSFIVDYMVSHRVDSITYHKIREDINPDFDDEWIEQMLGQYDSLFVPFYTHNENAKYPESHGIKLRKKLKH